jgi:hypothetical protein
VRTEDGTGSGYVAKGYSDFTKLDTAAATKIAVQKAAGSVNAKALEPGKYTVILEPTAAVVLLENIFFDMDARSADEGRSFLSKPGGKTRLGEKLVTNGSRSTPTPRTPTCPLRRGPATAGRRKRSTGSTRARSKTCTTRGTGRRNRA